MRITAITSTRASTLASTLALLTLVASAASTPVGADAGWGLSHLMNSFGPGVSGSGHIRSESRAVGRFDAIDLRDSTDIEVRVGSPASLSIEADDNILPLIVTEVEQGRLTIRSTGSYRTRRSPKVVVTTPSLSKLMIHGSGDASLSHLEGSRLSLAISGSGDIRADGEVDSLSLDIDGSGDANLVALQSRSASVSINGSGDARLSVSDSLNAVVNGSGDISYAGNPAQVSSRVHGSGDISRR